MIIRNLITYNRIAVVILYAIALSLSAAEKSESDGQTSGNGMSHANQIITADENQLSGQRDTPKQESQNISKSAPTVFDDIALSQSTVSYNSLGLIIRNRFGDKVSVSIHDSKGRLVLLENYSSRASTINVRTDGFVPGAYVYAVQIGEKVLAKPFIVAH